MLIISGPPGVGKSTLAEMVVYSHLANGWDLIAIRHLDDGLAAISDAKKQIFYFDDFLGRVALDRQSLAKTDSDLARFIGRIRRSPNARFVLTTRAPIFEEARRHSEHLADKRLDVNRYLLDVGVYTCRIRARILYNHLLVMNTPPAYIEALIESGGLPSIVDHRNYSPRLIALMTDKVRIKELLPAEYPGAFLSVLKNPTELWDIPFRNHITTACQHLLLTLFFCGEFGIEIHDFRVVYQSYHTALCARFGQVQDPKDFEEALRILEGGFTKISGQSVSFVNPSVRDYLATYVDDWTLLRLAAASSQRTDWSRSVWRRSKAVRDKSGIQFASYLAEVAREFLPSAEQFVGMPVYRTEMDVAGYAYRVIGISNTDRMELLIEWWQATGESRFLEICETLAARPVGAWDPWLDGPQLIALTASLRDRADFDEMPRGPELAALLEEASVEMIVGNALSSDDLSRVSDAIDEWRHSVPASVVTAMVQAVQWEFDNVSRVVGELDSESTVDEHIDILYKLGPRAFVPEASMRRALRAAADRKVELEGRTSVSTSPFVRDVVRRSDHDFSDSDLANLFAPLRRRTQESP